MIWRSIRSILFHLDPEFAHGVGAFFLQILGYLRNGEPKKISFRAKSYSLGGLELYSPLGLAAGFDKNAKLIRGASALGFGFVEVGTVTPLAQKGNPRPRLFRLPESRALVNRMGFNSEGADVVAERLERLRAIYRIPVPVGVNIGKNRDTPLEKAALDYDLALRRLYPYADYIVVNISSPNTPGLTSLQEGDGLAALLDSVRKARDQSAKFAPGNLRPLFLKLSPDLNDASLREAVECAMNHDFAGIIATNTTRRRDLPGLVTTDKSLGEEGGLSGAPLRAEAIERIRKLRSWMAPRACLISVGGLGGVDDARERLAHGANLLQVYTEFVYAGPSYPGKIARELAKNV